MTAPTVTPRAARIAVLMLDTRVGGRYIDRATYKRIGAPIPATARRIAVRLAEAAGEPITGDDVIAGARALTTAIPTYELRAFAAAAPEETTR